jgi:tetratricopeptide (TPR) repeat protein
VRAKLTQLYPARGGALPAGLVEALMSRAQGNPFYLEELLNYVRDRGLDPSDIQNIELPDSLHTLILSRIDQLSEAEKTTLRVASIVGRLFRAKWLTGYYPELGSFPQVKAALDELDKLEITPLDSEPELTYLFKHIVTHEVTYESLPFATRARLHEQLAVYLESVDAPVETIAFHYLRSENKAKQMEYLRKAGEASQKNFANDAALEYYGQLLPLLNDDKEKSRIQLQRGRVLQLIGKYFEAESDYLAALGFARDDLPSKASAQFALGRLNRLRGDYEPALDWLEQAKEAYTKLEDTAGLAQVFIESGIVLLREGKYERARVLSNKSLELTREAGDQLTTVLVLNNLANVALEQGDYGAAQALFEESLTLSRAIEHKAGIAMALNNLGGLALEQGDYLSAKVLAEESLELSREMGGKLGTASTLNNLGYMAMAHGDYGAAQNLFEECLVLIREIGGKREIIVSLINLGNVSLAHGDYNAARELFEESVSLFRDMKDTSNMAYILIGLGLVDLAEGKPEARKNILGSLRLRVETGEQLPQSSSLIGAAGLVLQDGNPQFAAGLLGAVESALKALNAVVEPDVKFFHEGTLAKVKQALGEEVFQSAWEEGSQWSLDEAVKKVLGE